MADTRHAHTPDVSFDGGDLDCGNGLLLLIRRHIDPLDRGQLLEILSTEISVREDLPAWCRMTGNELVSVLTEGRQASYLVCKGALSERSIAPATAHVATRQEIAPVTIPDVLPDPAPAPAIPRFAVMGMGSWPRPRWMVQAVHERMQGRLAEADFEATADDAVRLAVDAQVRAGCDVITDGEQRRDSYASFVGARLDNCQLIPLTDLLPLVDDPEHFAEELRALDVPAGEVRHPAVFGPLGRSRPLALHEYQFARTLTDRPIKVALPGPYLLTRTMWLECLSERAYETRDDIAADVVRVLREELAFLLGAGVAIVQFDEPVLSEVVFTGPKQARSFMCGALSEKGESATELAFARDLVNAVTEGFPIERVALHMCRGNWTPDETKCLAGDYTPLVGTLAAMRVGTYFLELCTPRAGELEVLEALPADRRIGVGVVNQKDPRVETVDEILAKARHAARLFGGDRVLLTPDCGFATFADNPVASAAIAERKLAAIAEASARLRA
ncbi:MAG: 5-methyltetrahydropteroyltriglutamate--homocysteine methyltransferase [Betaproteobacteria bacterium]|nr:5-methyltetrahydropteroyltriglutamate--homocysteine methyltransferase [Betaproteobacteria bacterium]